MRGKVNDPLRAYQPFDFSGCLLDRGITPTNIVLSVDVSPSAFLVGEVKLVGATIPKGQKMHLARIAESHFRGGSDCFVFIAEHDTDRMDEIKADEAKVTEYYWRHEWHTPLSESTSVYKVCKWFAEKHGGKIHKPEDPWT